MQQLKDNTALQQPAHEPGVLTKDKLQDVVTALSSGACKDPAVILDVLSLHPLLLALLETGAGIWERDGKVTIREHTLNFLAGFTKYPEITEFIRNHAPAGLLTLGEFQLISALHDVGKHLPPACGLVLPEGTDKADQHARTLLLLQRFSSELPLSSSQTDLSAFLIGSDRLGALFKAAFQSRRPPTSPEKRLEKDVTPCGRPIKTKIEVEQYFRRGEFAFGAYRRLISSWEALIAPDRLPAAQLQGLASAAAKDYAQASDKFGVPAAVLLQLQTLYFQLDIRAYTADAPTGTPSLDYLLKRNPAAADYRDRIFVFDRDRGRFLFSDAVEPIYTMLLEELDRLR